MSSASNDSGANLANSASKFEARIQFQIAYAMRGCFHRNRIYLYFICISFRHCLSELRRPNQGPIVDAPALAPPLLMTPSHRRPTAAVKNRCRRLSCSLHRLDRRRAQHAALPPTVRMAAPAVSVHQSAPQVGRLLHCHPSLLPAHSLHLH